MAQSLNEIDLSSLSWKSIKNDSLDLEYAVTIPRSIANALLKELEDTLCYYTGDLAKIKVFGKVYALPRQQVAFGDSGITYTYSGITVPALPWTPAILSIRNFLFKLKGIKYDFVLVNKYRNGNDHMGEHRDNEPDLDPNFPIASVSLGAERPFILKHRDTRKPGPNKKAIPKITINLEHGSVLLMNPPTNEVWYHSLPTRKRILDARINLTFRKMREKNIL
ncbi:DNA oxidative demethylase ALKBH2-like [Vanessa cardui]|uniref:DNA oxidative demethylase ALKBH2-like n=1 Tax=Vanessa cardui TaxID=171605 RepID=UPI001F14238B|nr:DNA oxidative demethylase ALKBH2-like [Vanessa cardui]